MARNSLTYILGFSVKFTIPARFGLIWFSGFRGKDLNVIFYQNMSNLYNQYQSVERKPNLAGIVLGYSHFKIVSDSSTLHSRWLLLLKIEISSIVHCCFSISQNELKLFGLIWFSGFRGKDLNVIFYQNMPNLHNRYKSAERKISQKNPEYMLNYSLPCETAEPN
jgi:hypothetical protein